MDSFGQNYMSAPQPQFQQGRRGTHPKNGIRQQPHADHQNGFEYNSYTVPYQQPHTNYQNDSQYNHYTAPYQQPHTNYQNGSQYNHYTAPFQQSYTAYQNSSNLDHPFGPSQLPLSLATNYEQGFGLGYAQRSYDSYASSNPANSFNPWEQNTQMGQPPCLGSPHQGIPQQTGITPPYLPSSYSAGYGGNDLWLQQLPSNNPPQQPVRQPIAGYSQMIESSMPPPSGGQVQENGTLPSTALHPADPATMEGNSKSNPINIDDDPPPNSTPKPATEWVDVTDLVYAAKEEPGEDDMIHEVWIFMNWMRSHRSQLSFDEKAKTHKWFVSVNDYKRLFYIRVDDGTKEYGWGLENRLRCLQASERDMGQAKQIKVKQAGSRKPQEQRQPRRKEREKKDKSGRARKEEEQVQKAESYARRRKERERIKKLNGSGKRGGRQQKEGHLEQNENGEANNYPEGDVEEKERLQNLSEDAETADLVDDCERLMEEDSEESEAE